jgi:NADPH-dependent curcumin reductase CurA
MWAARDPQVVQDDRARCARVAIWGAVSLHDNMAQVQGPSLYIHLAERQSVMEGFAYFRSPDSMVPA